ncbi:MAG: multicopper oxidase family protein [Gemmatimonadetes bacterium]|nr:multicopper oxidase family protein [Gemmatimonadota bacterium]
MTDRHPGPPPRALIAMAGVLCIAGTFAVRHTSDDGDRGASTPGACAAASPGGGAAVDIERAAPPSGPSADLYCIELLPAAGIDRAAGTAELRPPPSPFGFAVTPGGTAVWDVVLELAGLPDPASLGRYTTYVAWAMPTLLAPVVKLGRVHNGRIEAGRIAFDQFLIIISAEATADVTAREGRLVLRGLSASTRMQPHDLPFLLAGLLDKDTSGGHAGHGVTPRVLQGGDLVWSPPPMHPAVTMPEALMTLRPDVDPLLPVALGSVARAIDASNAPFAAPRTLVRLADGDTLELVAAPVRKRIGDRTIAMLGFNGQIPGPLVQVDRGVTVHIRFVNRTPLATTVHWHGIRLDNRFDGVPHVTQDPVPAGAWFDYTIRFPDAGLYWYHPHLREDVLQDLGLYGNLFVRPDDPAWLGPANREEFLVLDDLLIDGAGILPYGAQFATHALMGRFGNRLLVNGEPQWTATADAGEVVRLWLTNVSSTRVFNLSFEGEATMKVVASDLGRYEHEQWVDNIVIAPAERYVIDVRFERAGAVRLLNRVRAIDHLWGRFFDDIDTLGIVRVRDARARPDHAAAFGMLRSNQDVIADITRYRPHFERPPDHTLVVTLEPGNLPFPLTPMMSFESVYRNPVEWEGTMPEMDWVATARQARWILRDAATGRENMAIDWRFRTGDIVKIRLINDRNALHAMQHPIHVHGQRFLVLSVNGVDNPALVWKDTVLLPAGFAIDILLELTNPGSWMLHCHVAEHIEAGMHSVFYVNG